MYTDYWYWGSWRSVYTTINHEKSAKRTILSLGQSQFWHHHAEMTSKNSVQLLYLDTQWIIISMSFDQYLSRRLKRHDVHGTYHQRVVSPDIINHGLTHPSRDYAMKRNVVIQAVIKPDDLAQHWWKVIIQICLRYRNYTWWSC